MELHRSDAFGSLTSREAQDSPAGTSLNLWTRRQGRCRRRRDRGGDRLPRRVVQGCV